jgi:hypothetical protein
VTRFAFARSLIDELKESRLWPLALALVVALVAIPVVLSKPAKQGPGANQSSSPLGPVTLPDLRPIAKVTTPSPSSRKSVIRLSRKNPFAPLSHAGQTTTTASQFGSATVSGTTGASGAGSGALTTTTGSTGGGSTGSTTTGGSTGSAGSTGSTPAGSSAPAKVYYSYVADVRFGELGTTETKTLQRMRSLPSSDNPIVVFLGATTDANTAVFLVSTSAKPSGDGTCKPSNDQCLFLYMKKGDAETFDVADDTGALKTYELTLRKIEAKVISDPTKSSAGTSSLGSGRSAAAANADARKADRKVYRYFQAIQRIGF